MVLSMLQLLSSMHYYYYNHDCYYHYYCSITSHYPSSTVIHYPSIIKVIVLSVIHPLLLLSLVLLTSMNYYGYSSIGHAADTPPLEGLLILRCAIHDPLERFQICYYHCTITRGTIIVIISSISHGDGTTTLILLDYTIMITIIFIIVPLLSIPITIIRILMTIAVYPSIIHCYSLSIHYQLSIIHYPSIIVTMLFRCCP